MRKKDTFVLKYPKIVFKSITKLMTQNAVVIAAEATTRFENSAERLNSLLCEKRF